MRADQAAIKDEMVKQEIKKMSATHIAWQKQTSFSTLTQPFGNIQTSPSSKPHEISCLGPVWINTDTIPACAEPSIPLLVSMWTEPPTSREHVLLCPCPLSPTLNSIL